MSFPPSVLLLDDGELSDIRRLLEELGVDFIHVRGASISDGLEVPRDLLLTTARRAQTLPAPCKSPDAPNPVRVVVAGEDATTLRGRLRSAGIDFLVRRPVHSEALRLLVLKSLYRGPERRQGVRVPFGIAVSYQCEGTESPAILAELSLGGCRLLCSDAIEADSRLQLSIAPEASDGAALELTGRAVRCVQGIPGGEPDEYAVAIAFDDLEPSQRERLAGVMKRRMVSVSDEEARERRIHPRRAFTDAVTSLDEEAGRALVGRDLSMGGMRIEAHPELKVGQQLQLAIYGFADELPTVVEATVVREDNDGGLALRFDNVDDETGTRLERLVAVLPAVEPLAGGETDALGAVVSEILSPGASSR